MQITKAIDKASSAGALLSALSCAGCFPALGSLGVALGLGFLAPYEGLMFRKLLPAFAALALVANVVAWYRHKNALRGSLSLVGPAAVLLALLVFWHRDWGIYVFYVGLALMVCVSLFDLFKPVARKCPT
ncbi:organomercurial transporter MerC [Lysobacter sp. A6]|uniref:Organomercurial transporter MerC n=1 Tax=Noviluteimonas lactosilytica TaxID=2888523 RepID=A0ABS8JDL5_9GAMM|nr:organomercurial transporter MerC [Lysobacter lactosilyticus]MCC8361700.1 organomercurial transporter MerC [Lysobacter lactosilyticus]